MSKFKVGDKVRVVDSSLQYSTYTDLVRKLLPEKILFYRECARVSQGSICKVLASHIHTTMPEKGMVYIIENAGGQIFVMGEKSLELIEPALPRICYILGGEDTPLEIGEEFSLNAYDPEYKKDIYVKTAWIDKNGTLQGFHNKDLFSDIINHPEKIIRKPKIEFSDDEKAFMRLLIKKKHKWIARDRVTTSLAAYTEEPYINSCEDFDSNGYYADIPEFLFPQITPDNSPINMEDYI